MLTLHKIEVDETPIPNGLIIQATTTSLMPMNVVHVLQPFYDKGYKVKTLFFDVESNIINANLKCVKSKVLRHE